MKTWTLISLFFVFFAQIAASDSSSCSRPSQGTLGFYYHKLVNTDKQKIFEKCVNDYYVSLIEKMHKRDSQIGDELAVLKLEMKKVFPEYNPYMAVVDCQRAKNRNRCSEIVVQMNKLIDEQREINGWYGATYKTSKQEVAEKQKPSCAEMKFKCPDERSSLSSNQCLMEFYLMNCI